MDEACATWEKSSRAATLKVLPKRGSMPHNLCHRGEGGAGDEVFQSPDALRVVGMLPGG